MSIFPQIAPLVVPLVDGRQANIEMPRDMRDFPAKVKLEIVAAAGRPGYFLADRWTYGSITTRNRLRNEANLHDADIDSLMVALRDWVVAAQRTIEASLQAPEEKSTAPYGLIRRTLTQSAAEAFSYSIGTPQEVCQLFLQRGFPDDTVIEWPKDAIERLVIVDLDFHRSDTPKPDLSEIDRLGDELSPAPWQWWRTQGGGLHALYVQSPNSPFTALELAAGAVAQLTTDPVVVRCRGTVETVTRTRHPSAKQKNLICGPVRSVTPTEDFICLAEFSRAEATDAEIQEVLDEHGLVIGQRLDHSFCLIDPGHVSTSQNPVVVCEKGLYCHSCAGRLGNGWVSWGAIRRAQGMSSETKAGNEPIMAAVRGFVQFSHVNYLLDVTAPHLPKDMRRHLYSALLKSFHRIRADVPDPRVRAALVPFPFVRGAQGWLHESSLALVKPGLGKDDIAHTAAACYFDAEGELKPLPVQLTVMTRNGPIEGWYPIIPDSFAPLYTVHNRIHQSRHRHSAVVCTAWDVRNSPDAVRYRSLDQRIAREEAERRILNYFPGLSLQYMTALLVAIGCADSNRGMVPMLWVTGDTGAAKSTTADIVSEMLGEPKVNLSNVREDRIDQIFGENLSITRMIKFDDCAKDPRTFLQLISFILRLQRTHTSHQLYIGGVSMPVRSAVVFTDKRTPEMIFSMSQVGRRVHVIPLEGTVPRWNEMGHNVEDWWRSTPELLDASESFFSYVVDEFFPEGDTESFDTKMARIGVNLISETRLDPMVDEARYDLVRSIAMAICEAPALNDMDERRLGIGSREVTFASNTPLGKRCLDLVEMQGPVEPGYETLLHSLESYDGALKSMLGLACAAKFQVKQQGRRVFVRLVESGRSHAKLRINRELFPSWPPTFASPSDAPQPVPVIPQLPGLMQTTSEVPTVVVDIPVAGSRFFHHPESNSYVAVSPTDLAAFSQSPEAALCVEVEESEYCEAMDLVPDAVQTPTDVAQAAVESFALASVSPSDAPTVPGYQTVFIDFETQSACNLKKFGGYVYAQHPTTIVICAAIRIGPYRIFWTKERFSISVPANIHYLVGTDELREMVQSGPTCLVPHNMNFERPIWVYTLGLPEPELWIDTADITLTRGLPAGADQAGEYLLGMGKDIEGYKLMMKTCKPNKKGEMPVITDAIVQRYVGYNFRDTDIGVGIAQRFGLLAEPAWEQEVIHLHQSINHFGIRIDRDFAETLRSFDEVFKAQAGAHVEYITKGEVTRADLARNDFLRGWLGSKGLELDNMRADNMEKLIDGFDEGEIEIPGHLTYLIDVLKDRMVVTRAAMAKVDTALRFMSMDGRAKAQLRYAGAHTGRWSGYGIQPQNMRRPDEDSFDLKAAIEAVERKDIDHFRLLCRHRKTGRSLPPYELLSSLVRGLIVPEPGSVLLIGDFAQIEARALLWLSDDWGNMQEHLDFDAGKGPDVYCTLASTVYGKLITKKDFPNERQAGKIGQLACVAEGTPVLTLTGWKAIESVTTDDLVWDGVSWVTHDGLVDRGVRECIEVDGVWLTRDHLVLTENGWEEAGCLNQQSHFPGIALDDGRCWLVDLRENDYAGAHVAPRVLSSRTTCGVANQQDATRARSNNQCEPGKRTPGTQSLFPATHIDGGCSIATPPSSLDAANPVLLDTIDMVRGESEIDSQTLSRSFSTSSLFPGGTTPSSKSIESTTTATMNRETSGSPSMPCRSTTPGGRSESSIKDARGSYPSSAGHSARGTESMLSSTGSSVKDLPPSKSSSSKTGAVVRTVRTYDLANAGPWHRFQAGSLIVHNCGYGGAEGAINRFAYALDIDLESANVTSTQIKEAWRSKHPKAVRLWKDYEWAARKALETPGKAIDAGHCTFQKLDGNLYITLPSGRKLHYHNARIEPSQKKGWENSLAIVYDSAVKGKTVRHETYSGKITENIDQAFCRDLLAWAMLRFASEGYAIPMHVHDEIVGEVPEDQAEQARLVLEQIMCDAPPWAYRMPCVAKPGIEYRYGK